MTSSKEPQIQLRDRPGRRWPFGRRPEANPGQPPAEPLSLFSHRLGVPGIQTEDLRPPPRFLRRLRRRSPLAKPDDVDAAPFSAAGLVETENLVARSLYGKLLVWCYVVFVAAVLIVPFVSWAFISQTRSASQFMSGLRDVQDFALAMLGGLSVLGGFVGLIIGRYFSTHQV